MASPGVVDCSVQRIVSLAAAARSSVGGDGPDTIDSPPAPLADGTSGTMDDTASVPRLRIASRATTVWPVTQAAGVIDHDAIRAALLIRSVVPPSSAISS